MARICPDASDAELLNGLRAGQQEALRILYGRYSGLVYTTALRILNQPDEAEDLTQEIFLTFWKQDKFQPSRAALSTYLSIVTRSRAINKLNSRSSQQRSIDRLQQSLVTEWSDSTPLEKASLAEQHQVLQQAMNQIPDNQRRVLEMNYYQNLSQSEIARHLQIPLGTVKTNARQGLIKLRRILGTAVG